MRTKLPLSIAAAILAATACGAEGVTYPMRSMSGLVRLSPPTRLMCRTPPASRTSPQKPACPSARDPFTTSSSVPGRSQLTIVATLNSGHHTASIKEFATTVFDASQGTLRRVACTQSWGPCPLTRVRVNRAWKPSRGSDGAMVVVDYKTRTVFDFWQVARNADGTVKIGRDGVVRTGWGGVSSLDGTGASPGATGSNLSHLFGMIRVREVRAAVSNWRLPHRGRLRSCYRYTTQIAFASSHTCSSYRSPATKSDGTYSGARCVPMGSVVYLRADANCAFRLCSADRGGGLLCTQEIWSSHHRLKWVTDVNWVRGPERWPTGRIGRRSL